MHHEEALCCGRVSEWWTAGRSNKMTRRPVCGECTFAVTEIGSVAVVADDDASPFPEPMDGEIGKELTTG